jgi:hypothetical protein
MVEQYLNFYLFLQVIMNLMGNQEEKDYLIADYWIIKMGLSLSLHIRTRMEIGCLLVMSRGGE